MHLRFTQPIILLAFILISPGCENSVKYNWSDDPLETIIIDNDEKIILVDFERESCVWCDRLDADTFSDQKVIDFAKQNLISKKIDAEKGDGPKHKEKYRVRAYPTILFLDSQGTEIDRIVGYRPPEEFLSELNRIKKGENTISQILAKYEQNKHYYPAQIALAEKYVIINLPDSAKSILDIIYRKQKKKSQLDFSVAFSVSKLYYSIGSLDNSIDLLDQIVDSGVDSSDSGYFYGLLYKAKRDNDTEKLLQYSYLTENIDRKKQAYWQIIRILRKEKKEPDLEADIYQKAVELYDSEYKYLPSLLNSFARRMTKLEKKLDIALEKIDLALEYGEDIKMLDTKAEVLWKLKRIDEAVTVIEKCILLDPKKKYYKDQKNKFLGSAT